MCQENKMTQTHVFPVAFLYQKHPTVRFSSNLGIYPDVYILQEVHGMQHHLLWLTVIMLPLD